MPLPGQSGRGHEIKPEDAKRLVLEYVRSGLNINDALRRVGRSRQGYEYWRKTDAQFAADMDFIHLRRQGKIGTAEVPDFPEFCAQYLKQPLPTHLLRAWDVMNGREPRELHPTMTYESAGDRELFLFNFPPDHAKSTSLGMNYVTWRIVKDPRTRVIYLSKTQVMAKKFLYGIKQRLDHPSYADLQRAFGPADGYRATAEVWAKDMITLATPESEGEKDPTIQALGLEGHIYGARADIIILDDIEDFSTGHMWESHVERYVQDIQSRVVDTKASSEFPGMVLVLGTRVAAKDFYTGLRHMFPGEWNYLAQPAVLEYATEVRDWKVLWPTYHPPEWYEKRMRRVTATIWARAYQQSDVEEDATFPAKAVKASVDGQRYHGPLHKDTIGHRKDGMDGLYIVAGLDPALSGFCAAVVMGVDKGTKERWVLDVHNKAGMRPAQIHDLMKTWTVKYGIQEWRVEKNAMQGMLTQDASLLAWLSQHSSRLREHFTGRNKWDADYGVAAMSALFQPAMEDPPRKPLVRLPSPRLNGAVDQLVEQLVSWTPDTKGTGSHDIVMALWFAEVRARELVTEASYVSHIPNRYVARAGASRRVSISVHDALEMQREPIVLI